MDYSEYVLKYEKLEQENKALKAKELAFENPYTKELREHPVSDKHWINYARDCGFSFSCLQLPRKDVESQIGWYNSLHNDFESYEKLMTVDKEFTICPTCGTRWTLQIQLNGDYAVFDQCGTVVIDTNNQDNKYMFYYKLPEYISTVSDLQKILDVIEMCKHGDQ